MNWISNWKKIGIKVKQILKKQPVGQQETDWKNCPQCKKISESIKKRQNPVTKVGNMVKSLRVKLK